MIRTSSRASAPSTSWASAYVAPISSRCARTRLDRPAVLAREVVELAEALADFVQPLRVELDARVVVLQKLRGFFERDLGRADVRERLVERRVDAGEVLELVSDEDDPVVERVVGLRDLAVELGRRLVEPLGVLEDAALRLEAVRLADDGRRLVDLLDLERVELLLSAKLGLAAHDARLLGDEPRHVAVRRAVRAHQTAEAAERVEQLDVRLGPQQRLVLVLAVQVDRVRRDLAEHVERRRRVVDERAAAGGGDLAADDEHAVLAGVDAVLLEERGQAAFVGVVELPFDDRLLRARPQRLGRGAVAEEQAERTEQDRFARARLPRDDVEPAVELDLELVDERVVADVKRAEHRAWDTGCGMRDEQTGALPIPHPVSPIPSSRR